MFPVRNSGYDRERLNQRSLSRTFQLEWWRTNFSSGTFSFLIPSVSEGKSNISGQNEKGILRTDHLISGNSSSRTVNLLQNGQSRFSLNHNLGGKKRG